jgi:hypothetical protein
MMGAIVHHFDASIKPALRPDGRRRASVVSTREKSSRADRTVIDPVLEEPLRP